jgi:hypothetical protein
MRLRSSGCEAHSVIQRNEVNEGSRSYFVFEILRPPRRTQNDNIEFSRSQNVFGNAPA